MKGREDVLEVFLTNLHLKFWCFDSALHITVTAKKSPFSNLKYPSVDVAREVSMGTEMDFFCTQGTSDFAINEKSLGGDERFDFAG